MGDGPRGVHQQERLDRAKSKVNLIELHPFRSHEVNRKQRWHYDPVLALLKDFLFRQYALGIRREERPS